MEVYISLTHDQYKASLSSNFIIKFYWFEKNRTFEINKSNFTHNPSSEYQYYYKLPSIVKGKYRFFATGSISLFHLKLVYKNDVILESKKNNETPCNNHFFSILENKLNGNAFYTTHPIPAQQFIHDEQKQRRIVTTRALKRWNYYWYNIHYFTFNYYPTNPSDCDKQQIIHLIRVMATNGIPCEICKNHFRKYIYENPIDDFLINNIHLSKYFVQLHNHVNKTNNKPIFSFQNALDMYKKTNEFENKLKSVCKPMYLFFNEANLKSFPITFLSNEVLHKL
jgi:hypothetical protein